MKFNIGWLVQPPTDDVPPNPAVNRTRRFMASTWLGFVRRAYYVTRWAATRLPMADPNKSQAISGEVSTMGAQIAA